MQTGEVHAIVRERAEDAEAAFKAAKLSPAQLIGLLWNQNPNHVAIETLDHQTVTLVNNSGGESHMSVRFPRGGNNAATRPGAIIALHGAMSSRAEILPYFAQLADRLNLVVLCPDAQHVSSRAESIELAGPFAGRYPIRTWIPSREDFPLTGLRWALKNMSIDANRIILAGISMGGIATWNLAMRMWHHFAAVIPINGALSMWEAFGPDGKSRFLLPNTLGVPLYVIHGSNDEKISPQFDRQSVAELRAISHPALQYAEVAGGNHAFQSLCMENDGVESRRLMEWLLHRSRTWSVDSVRHHAISDDHGRAHWIALSGITPSRRAVAVAQRVRPDCYRARVHGARYLDIYLTSDGLAPGQPVTLDVNGDLTVFKYNPQIRTVVETYQLDFDPALTAEQVVRVEIPAD